jgi:hypothetical protein
MKSELGIGGIRPLTTEEAWLKLPELHSSGEQLGCGLDEEYEPLWIRVGKLRDWHASLTNYPVSGIA